MAKDNIGLLNEIAGQLKKMNQSQIRRDIQDQAFRDAQQKADATGQMQETNFDIGAAEDFKRRVKGSVVATKLSEKFTDSGKRAKASVKKIKEEKKYKKLTSVRMKERRVGLGDVVEASKFQSEALNFLNIDSAKSLTTLQLIKVNSDATVQMLGGIRHALGMKNKNDAKQNKKVNKAAANAQRSAAEDKLEKKKLQSPVVKAILPPMMPKAPTAKSPSYAKLFLRLAALPVALVTWAIAGVTAVVSDFITGFKEDGLAGAIGKALGGSGEGIWNSIKQSFKVGGVGATIGGAIGLLFGGIGAIPGAIIGGLIGMAIGAVAGYFGGDKITAGLKDAGKAVSDAWEGTKRVFHMITDAVGKFFYEPGVEGQGGHQEATKTKIFGGFINWNPGEFSIAGAWQSAKDSIKRLFKSIGNLIYNHEEKVFFGGLPFEMEAPDWFVVIVDSVSKVWDTLKDFGKTIKNAVIGMLPDWLTDRLGLTVNGKLPGEVNTINPNEATGGNDMTYGRDIASYSTSTAAFRAATANAGFSGVTAIGDTAEDNVGMSLINRFANSGMTMGQIMNAMTPSAEMRGSALYNPEGIKPVVVNTDNSSNTGAVIINNIYSDAVPMGHQGLVNIHDHFDANQTSFKHYGLGY